MHTIHYITLHYTTLHYITLHYITLHSIPYHTYTNKYIYIDTRTHTYIIIYICIHTVHIYILYWIIMHVWYDRIILKNKDGRYAVGNETSCWRGFGSEWSGQHGTNIKTREDDWRIAPKKGWTDLKRCLFPILVGLHFSICLILFRGSRSSFF